MNRKGQVNVSIGGFIMLAIVLIVGAILLQASAQNVGQSVNTIDVVNQSVVVPVNGTAYAVTGFKSLSNVVVFNGTTQIVGAGNYTITNNGVVNGVEVATITPTATTGWGSPHTWKVTYTGQPSGYMSDAGSRSVANMIVIFFALAMAAVAIGFGVKSYVGD
jgi:hypothetical protein